MAVIEIAKIQVRRGQENQTGVPQLDGGEFAWAADAERLYIGLRREDGGSRDANVEILTENHLRNLFNASFTTSTYIYRGEDGSYITALGATEDEFERSIQDKLDDIVSVKDFGVYGNGVDWDLAQLQLAIDRLFLNTAPELANARIHPRKKLYFPTGNYLLTGTVYIPAHTTIIGDGPGKTIFTMAMSTSTLFKTCDMNSDPDTAGYITFDSIPSFDLAADSARYVTFEDVTLTYDNTNTTTTEALTLLSLDCAQNASIKNVDFIGNYHALLNETMPNTSYIGLKIRGMAAEGLRSENVVIDNCVFDGLYHGIISNHDIMGTIVQNSEFINSIRGISLNDPASTAATIGPNNVRILNNKFNHIYQEGIYVGVNNPDNPNPGGQIKANFVTSQNNHFSDVGNFLQGNLSSNGVPVIKFLTEENISVNDRFDRLTEQNRLLNNTPASTNTMFNSLVYGLAALDNVSVSTARIDPPDETEDSTSTVVLRLPLSGFAQHLNVKYNVFQQANTTASVAVAVTSGTNIELNSSVGVLQGAHVSGAQIVPGTIVESVTGTIIVLDTPVIDPGLAQGEVLYFSNNVGRMGNVEVAVQSGGAPYANVVDNYNYTDVQSELVQFGVTVTPDYKFYEVFALSRFPASMTLEMQTRIMY